jgi:hypothetical protein
VVPVYRFFDGPVVPVYRLFDGPVVPVHNPAPT